MIDTSKNNVGKKAKIKNSFSTGHSYPIDSKGTITSCGPNNVRLKEYPTWSFYPNELEICPETREEIEKTIEEIGKTISELQIQIDEENSKLKFMKENNIEEFDETQYKVFKTLFTLEDKNLSAIEKSKLIASLING